MKNKFVISVGYILTLNVFLLSTAKAQISGQFKGLKVPSTIYLKSTDNEVHSVNTNEKGEFSFTNLKSNRKKTYFVTVIYDNGRFDFPLFILPQSNLHFEVNENYTEFSFRGDKNSMEQDTFYRERKKLFKLKDSLEKLNLVSDKNVAKGSTTLNKLNSKIENYTDNWIKEHLNSPFSLAALRLFKLKNINTGLEDFDSEELYDKITIAAKDNNSESAILENAFSSFNASYGAFKVGTKIEKLDVKDTLGKVVNYNLEGQKYTLVDFWASWCAPCRANNPKLMELYTVFKDKGLTVISVSLDEDALKWKEAIRKDKMTWLQGSDLLGQNAGLGLKYHIDAVPMYVLLNSNSEVVLRSIGGDVDVVRKYLLENL